MIAINLHCPPFVDISGVANFRDIGCCSNANSFSMRRGLVFRSADLSGMTAEGRGKLQTLGIRMVFDLRSVMEVDKSKNKDSQYEAWLASPKGPERIFVPIFQDDDFAPEALAVRFKDYSAQGTEGVCYLFGVIISFMSRKTHSRSSLLLRHVSRFIFRPESAILTPKSSSLSGHTGPSL